MFTVGGSRAQYCDGVSRRNFLQVGAAGVAGLTLADFLQADELRQHDAAYSKKSIINVYLGGGPSLTALLTLALIVARFTHDRWSARLIIIMAAIPIAVLVNGLRVAAAALAAQRYGAAAVEGTVHDMLGWLMFLVAFALLAACSRAVRGLDARRQPMAAAR